MCGIFGYAKLKDGGLEPSELRILIRALAMENETRGRDSTGIGIIQGENVPVLIRKVEKASEFLQDEFVTLKMAETIDWNTRKVLGHTRMATHGEVNYKNAQPFLYSHIMGTHNGVIHNYARIFEETKLPQFTTCDSEIIFALLAQEKKMKERAALLEKMTGYYAVAFHDFHNPRNLYFATLNNKVAVFMDKDRKIVVWSSSEHVLDDLAPVFNLKLKKVFLRDGYLTRIDENGEVKEKLIKKAGWFQGSEYGKNWNDNYSAEGCYQWKKGKKEKYKQHNRKAGFNRYEKPDKDDCALCAKEIKGVKTYCFDLGGWLCWACNNNFSSATGAIEKYNTFKGIREKLALEKKEGKEEAGKEKGKEG